MDWLIQLVEAVGKSENPTLFLIALTGLLVAAAYFVKVSRSAGKKKEDVTPVPEEPDAERKLVDALFILAEELKTANGQNATYLKSILTVNEQLVGALGGLKTGLVDAIVVANAHNIEAHDNSAVERFKETVRLVTGIEKKVDALALYVQTTLFAAIEKSSTPQDLLDVASTADAIMKATSQISIELAHGESSNGKQQTSDGLAEKQTVSDDAVHDSSRVPEQLTQGSDGI